MRRSHLSTILAALGMLALTPVALAANPVKGGTYSGTLAKHSEITITFKVARSGTKVTTLKTSNVPLYCSSGGPAVPVSFRTASISKAGRFTSTGRMLFSVGPNKGKVAATLTLTGRFLSGRKESGTIKTTYPSATSCNGSSSYSTKAT